MRADWRLTADLPATFLSSVYFGSQHVDFYQDFSTFNYSATKLKSVGVVLSNCGAPSGRDGIILELSKYFPVVSYGKCYEKLWSQEKQAEQKRGFYDLSFKQKVVLEKHMFAVAIPNVIEVDWIEEKVFSALHAGAIPIVLNSGTGNIQDFLPCTDCAIFVDHFSSVYEMSSHLKTIVNNETFLIFVIFVF